MKHNQKYYPTLVVLMISFIAGCGSSRPPETFVKTFDEPGTWRSVEVRDGLPPDDTWRTVVDALAQSYDLEVMDKESGYVRTSWKYTYVIGDKISENYRTRIIVKFPQDWEVAQIKSEANWLQEGGWSIGYDTRLLEDVYGDIQGRIGRVRR